MNNIIDSQVDSAVSEIIAAFISFVFANLLVVFLIIVVIACLIALYTLNSKSKQTSILLKRAALLQQDTFSRLSTVLVTDTFKELELGLAQGDTQLSLQRMQKAAFGLHKQSEELGLKLKGHRSEFFSPFESLHLAEELELEAEELHERVERYLNDLSGIEQSARRTDQHIRQLKERLESVITQIEQLGKDSGYSLDALRRQSKQVEIKFEELDQLAAFDAVQAKPESTKLGRLIDTLQIRIEVLQKNISIMDQIRTRLQKQEQQLAERIELEQLKFESDHPLIILRRTDPIMEQVDAALRSGEEVDLRATASNIEIILQEAVELIEGNGNK